MFSTLLRQKIFINNIMRHNAISFTDKNFLAALFSSIVDEVNKATLNFFIFFLQEDFHTPKKHKTHTSEQKKKRQHFYAHKKHLRGGKSLFCIFMLFVLFIFFVVFVLFVCVKFSLKKNKEV